MSLYINERLYTEIGDFWASAQAVFVVTHIWPSIGGTTRVKYTLTHLRSGEEITWNANEILAMRLKPITAEEVPLRVLGE
jgi:hypothetical protein